MAIYLYILKLVQYFIIASIDLRHYVLGYSRYRRKSKAKLAPNEQFGEEKTTGGLSPGVNRQRVPKKKKKRWLV